MTRLLPSSQRPVLERAKCVTVGWCMWVLLFVACALGRPLNQTKAQLTVFRHWRDVAANLSKAAKPKLLDILGSSSFKKNISAYSLIANKSPSDLLQILDDNIRKASILHSLPFLIGQPPSSEEVLKWGYVPNIWELINEGVFDKPNPQLTAFDNTETQLMNYPKFSKYPNVLPSRNETFDRPVYGALNIWRKYGGEFVGEGPIAFAASHTYFDSIFLAPVDTHLYEKYCMKHLGEGANIETQDQDEKQVIVCSAWKGSDFGTLSNFYHLVLPHLQFFGYNLADLYRRWYGNTEDGSGSRHYFEAIFSEAFLIPEGLNYAMASYELFGTSSGKNLQKSMRAYMKRPLVWTSNGDAPMIVDVIVDWISGDYVPTDGDRNTFHDCWTQKCTWVTLQKKMKADLHVHFLGYGIDTCTNTLCSNCRYIGYNHDHVCIYWLEQIGDTTPLLPLRSSASSSSSASSTQDEVR